MRHYQGTRIHICVIIRGLGYIYASVSEDQDTDMRQCQRIRIHICVSIRGLGYMCASVSEDHDTYMRQYQGTRIHTCVIIIDKDTNMRHASLSGD